MNIKKIQMLSILSAMTVSALLYGCQCKTSCCSKTAAKKAAVKKTPGQSVPSVMSKTLLNPVFSSNMVLQQEKPIAFFGYAGKDAPVKVEFAGKTVNVKANQQGEWRAEFPAMKAGHKNYTVKVTAPRQTVVLKDILIGDVWFCSGQSNMQMPIGYKFNRGWSAQNCEQEVKNANWPEIRYVMQVLTFSHGKFVPAQIGLDKSWVKTSPKYAGRYSATAYFFGRKLYKDLNIPIGLINSSWGGTRIQPWISREGFENAALETKLKEIRLYDLDEAGEKAYKAKEFKRFSDGMKAFDVKLEKAGAKEKAACAVYAKPDYKEDNWVPANIETKIYARRQVQIKWFRNTFKLNKNLQGKDIRISFIRNCGIPAAGIYLNGKLITSWKASDVKENRRVNISLKAAQFNQTGNNVLAIRSIYYHNTYLDGYAMRDVINYTTLNNKKSVQFLKNWKQKHEFVYDFAKAKVKLPPRPYIPYENCQFPTILFNSMVKPWTALPIKGVIWYQGCSDNGHPEYYHLQKALIADWRAQWNEPKLPFIITQLAGYGDRNWTKTPPTDARYALTRDIQQQMISDPNVGLACLIDIGEPANIHPANKQDVGYRLALEAERIAYGKKIVSRGPLFKKAEVKGKTIVVSFDNAEGLKTTDGKAPAGFAVAGADKKFVWADAKIQGQTVVVSSPKVAAPKYVRYAYAQYRGDLKLQNKQGLPAYPFRSDAYNYNSVKK